MLLTASSGRAAPFPALTPLLLLAAVALRVAELLGLVHGGRLDLRAHDVLQGLDPVRDDVPLLAVPLLDQDRTAALVISQLTLIGCVKPFILISSSRFSVRLRFSKPQRICSPVGA